MQVFGGVGRIEYVLLFEAFFRRPVFMSIKCSEVASRGHMELDALRALSKSLFSM